MPLCLKRLVSSRAFVVRSSRYGLRGSRVGEASNPGPRVRRRRRVLSSVSRSDSNFYTLLEEDLSVGVTVQVSSEAILEVQRGGIMRDSPEHELVQIHPIQRDSVQFSGATPVAVPRSVRDSESDNDSVPGIDRRTRRRLSLVWRSHTTDSVPEQNHVPDLSLSRARRPMQLVHQRSRMVSPRLATQATLVDSDMGDSFCDENVTPPPDAITPEVFRLSDHADAALFPSREVVVSRRVVLVPLSPGTPRSVQDRSVGSSGSRFAALESDDEAAEMESDSETDESDTESIQSVVQQEEEDMTVPIAGEVEVPEDRMSRAISEGLVSLDTVDMGPLFSLRAVVMKSPPKFLRGACRAAMRIALKEISAGATLSDEVRQTGGWKLLLLLPRMLFRPPRGGLIPCQRLFNRFTLFNQGAWIQLLIEGRECCEAAVNAGVRRRRRTMNDTTKRKVDRAQLRRRAQEPREPLSPEITGRRAESPFSLDHNLFTQNLRCARRGAAAGPSGVTAEHLKPILDSARDAELMCQTAELLARASIPEEVLRAIRIGKMTALQKPTGGCEASWRGTSFGGWCRGPLRSRPGRRWRRPQHLSNMPCPDAQGVSAVPMRSRR